MVISAISRSLVSLTSSSPSFSLFKHILSFEQSKSIPIANLISIQSNKFIFRSFISVESDPSNPKFNTKVNFSVPSDSESDSEEPRNRVENTRLPPPYDPFSKKPAIEEPDDPKNLQEIFHKMRSEGLINNAVRMFDGLSKEGLTHEALELFSQIKDKGNMPEVVAHTAVIEAYANAGECSAAHKAFLRMLASGVAPNAYTYGVLIKGFANGGGRWLGEAKKYVMEMMGKGMRPSAVVYVAVIEAFVREERAAEGKELVEEMKGKGLMVDEKGVREALKGRRGHVVRSVMDVLFAK